MANETDAAISGGGGSDRGVQGGAQTWEGNTGGEPGEETQGRTRGSTRARPSDTGREGSEVHTEAGTYVRTYMGGAYLGKRKRSRHQGQVRVRETKRRK